MLVSRESREVVQEIGRRLVYQKSGGGRKKEVPIAEYRLWPNTNVSSPLVSRLLTTPRSCNSVSRPRNETKGINLVHDSSRTLTWYTFLSQWNGTNVH